MTPHDQHDRDARTAADARTTAATRRFDRVAARWATVIEIASEACRRPAVTFDRLEADLLAEATTRRSVGLRRGLPALDLLAERSLRL